MTLTSANEPSDILIVEDSRTQMEQLNFMLERHGYSTRRAQNGVEALALLRERKPLLVISDITMPEMDGYELCRKIRSDFAMADLPVILLTSLSDPDDVIVGLEAGADSFVIKPPDEAYLVSQIRYITSKGHIRSSEGTRPPLEIQVGERKHFINADRLQILHLLLSTYESAVLRSKQLARAEDELRRVNESLEQKVQERTAALSAEIAERKRSETRFAAIFSASPVAIAIGRMDGDLIDMNPELCAFLGYKKDEMIGRATSELMLWADPEVRRSTIKKLQSEKLVRHHEVKFRHKSGEIRSALVSMEMLQIDDESLLLTMIVDVTDRKALEAQMYRMQRVESVGLLASGIAHDMNNILAPIMMAAPLLRMGLPAPELEKILSTIETSAQRGAALVRQLLIFGRGVEGERRPVNVGSILSEVAQISGQTFPRNITISTEVPETVWRVHGDATQLHQVMLNLCVNARDAMPLGGQIALSAGNAEIDEHYSALHLDAKPGRYVVVRVADSGTGIPPEVVDRVFDPFFTTKEADEGTGLGLSTVLGIVKSHGGFVRLQTKVGRGTTFAVHLPASANRESVPPIETNARLIDGNGELVMVVDDEENIRAMLRGTLVRHNYNVVTAQDGVEATAVFAANPNVKVVITDLDMPLMDGINLARVLRRLNPSVTLIISTGLGGRTGAEKRGNELAELGIKKVLMKPYTAEELLRVVHTALAETAAL
jgi:two-component system cell cycle sensor histidine kinase/response regulator CckA